MEARWLSHQDFRPRPNHEQNHESTCLVLFFCVVFSFSLTHLQIRIERISLQLAQKGNAIPSDLGRPLDRLPRTAIINTVRFHTEVIASLTYHFIKLNHNVTVFARDDALGMERVIHPFHAKGFKKYERFYETFYEFDTVVFATYPTCHLGLASNLVSYHLPQRYVAVLHNPDLLAADQAAAASLASDGDIQLLTITPHVNAYANAILEAEELTIRAQWFAPIFPVLFPEKCSDPALGSPSGAAADQPACNRSSVWQEMDVTAPSMVLEAELAQTNNNNNDQVKYGDEMEEDDDKRRRKLASIALDMRLRTFTDSGDQGEGRGGEEDGEVETEKTRDAGTSSSTPNSTITATSPTTNKPPPIGSKRQGFCVQGKLDPTRRSYDALFSDLIARKDSLLASDFSLVLQGKLAGRGGEDIMQIPTELEEEGLVRRYTSLPFQEFYEVLHSCIAIMPAFASDAYYMYKGSSSVAASLIADTPIIATPRLLAAYSFLDTSAVFMVPEGTRDVDAMEAVMSLPAEVIEGKHAAMGALRTQLYDRNLALFQASLGEQYLYHKRIGSEYKVMWYDFNSGPLFSSEPLRHHHHHRR